jgi:hypothetical protein
MMEKTAETRRLLSTITGPQVGTHPTQQDKDNNDLIIIIMIIAATNMGQHLRLAFDKRESSISNRYFFHPHQTSQIHRYYFVTYKPKER